MKQWILAFVAMMFGATAPASAQDLALHYWENDSIKTEVNDYEYPYDQISYRYGTPLWVSNLVELRLALWNGSEVWEYNTTKQVNGFYILTEVEDWTFSGAGPHQFAHVVLGDHAAVPTFTIDLTIHMEGNGSKAIRSDIVVSGVSGTMSGAKLYLYGDPNVSGNLTNDRVAYDASHGLFYAYDSTTTPNLFFGLAHATGTQLAMHYRGHVWTTPWLILDNIRYGQNLPDTGPAGAGDQVAGWNWDLGTVAAGGSANLTFYMGVGTSLNDLVNEVWAPLHRDGFESGDTSWWR
jgi:hypothetical protein